jgi:phosphoglycolate phosphatase
MTKAILVFDLDGTLADTAPDLLESLNHCLALDGVEPADDFGFRSYVGNGARAMIERAFAARQRPLAVPRLDALQAEFLQHYVRAMPGKSRLYPGVEKVLRHHRAKGRLLAVCTNKTEPMSVRLLEGLGVASLFSAICGSDTFAFRKPDPRHLFETIKMAGGDPGSAVMFGDSRTDIDTAKAAGIPVIAVDFGYSDRPVREFEPTHVISHYDEATPALVERMLRVNSTDKSP